jgi:orotidine-5'-phosphate decarboxylase
MGRDAVQPFLDYEERGTFLLAATSNPGAADFQLLEVDGEPLSLHVARTAALWNEHGNIGLVVGATRPDLLRSMRTAAPDLPFLIPGVGAQGGEPAEVVGAALDADGEGVIVAASRSILYADPADHQEGAARAADELRRAINHARERALAQRSGSATEA